MQQWSGTPDSSSLLVHYVYSFFFSAQVQEETERVGGCDPPIALIQSLFLQEVLGLGPNTKHQAEKLSIFCCLAQLPARLSTVRVWVYL